MTGKELCFPKFNYHVVEGELYFYPVSNLEALWDRFEKLPGETGWYVRDHIKRHGARIGTVSEMRACSKFEDSCVES